MHFSRVRTSRSLPYRVVSVRGGLCQGGLCPEGSLSRGVSVRETPSPCGQTDACENITLSQKLRLRAVIIYFLLLRIFLRSPRNG